MTSTASGSAGCGRLRRRTGDKGMQQLSIFDILPEQGEKKEKIRRRRRSGKRFKEDWRVRCPFYRKESPTEIRCAGLCGTHTTNTFRNRLEKEEHKYDFCNGIYTSCPLYIAIDENMD